MPGSAVAIKHIFSGGRDTISLCRASLKPDVIHSLMVLKHHLLLKRSSVIELDWRDVDSLLQTNVEFFFPPYMLTVPSLHQQILGTSSNFSSCTGLHRHGLVLQSTSVSFTDLHSIWSCWRQKNKVCWCIRATAVWLTHTIPSGCWTSSYIVRLWVFPYPYGPCSHMVIRLLHG